MVTFSAVCDAANAIGELSCCLKAADYLAPGTLPLQRALNKISDLLMRHRPDA
jgi:hypothetical protein